MDKSITGILCSRCGKPLGVRIERRALFMGVLKWRDYCEKCFPLLSEADKQI